MPKITGRVEILIDGISLLNKAGAVAGGIGLSGEPARERKAVMGDSGLHGFTEEPIVAFCEVTVTDREDIKLSDLAAAFENATCIYRSAKSGKVYTMALATSTMNFTLTAGEGEVGLRWEGASWVEGTY
jgi:hypothetical protein